MLPYGSVRLFNRDRYVPVTLHRHYALCSEDVLVVITYALYHAIIPIVCYISDYRLNISEINNSTCFHILDILVNRKSVEISPPRPKPTKIKILKPIKPFRFAYSYTNLDDNVGNNGNNCPDSEKQHGTNHVPNEHT